MKNQKRLRSVLMGVLVAGLVAAMPVVAQAGEYSLGAGAALAPDYEGSSDYDVIPVPFAHAHFDNGMYVLLEGVTLRANLIPNSWVSWLRFGPVYNYRVARNKGVNNSRVKRMKNVSDANEFGAFVGFEYNNWFANLEFLADTGNAYDGWYGTLKGGYNWTISEKWALSMAAFGTYADSDYMETYFGVDERDSLRSGLKEYKADKGMKDVGLELGLVWRFADHWSVNGIFNYARLVGDADDDSPVVDEGNENQVIAGALIVYHF